MKSEVRLVLKSEVRFVFEKLGSRKRGFESDLCHVAFAVVTPCSSLKVFLETAIRTAVRR